jgi:hypothetical protein
LVKKYQKSWKLEVRSWKIRLLIFGAISKSWFFLLGFWLIHLSNCNAGISFHGVVQNIFLEFLLWAIKGHRSLKHEIPSGSTERVEFQYFTDLQTIISAKTSANLKKLIHISKQLGHL